MIPVRDTIKTHRTPVVNYALIGINVVVFLWMFLNSGRIEQIYDQYALVPASFSNGLNFKSILNIFTSMFMHGGWMHLIGNMLYLWIFGDNIEDRLGSGKYLAFYLLGGVAAALMQILVDPSSPIPMVGASGAIAAVLGAYLVLYPNSRVYTFIPIGFWTRLRPVPAILVLGMWFLLQLINGVGSLGVAENGGTAYFAHIGGFLFGLLVGYIVKKQTTQPQPAPPMWS